MNRLSRADHLRYLASRVRWQAGAFAARRNPSRPPIGIVGAYYSGNVGDALMGMLVKHAITTQTRVAARRVSYDSVDRCPGLQSIVCGGGELGDADYFRRIFQSVPADRVSVIGTSPYCRLHEAPAALLEQIRQIAFFSVRSRSAREYMATLLQRDDILYAPDLVFSAPRLFPQLLESTTKRDRCGINVIPYYVDILKDGRLVPSVSGKAMLEQVDPQSARRFEELPQSYISVVERLIDQLLDRFDRVDVIPFSVGDEVYARSVLRHRPGVHFLRYTSHLPTLIDSVRRCNQFVATRFHAHILALITGTPLLSICYSSKCVNLLSDLGILDVSEAVTRHDLASTDVDVLVERIASREIRLSPGELEAISSQSEDALHGLCRHLAGAVRVHASGS